MAEFSAGTMDHSPIWRVGVKGVAVGGREDLARNLQRAAHVLRAGVGIQGNVCLVDDLLYALFATSKEPWPSIVTFKDIVTSPFRVKR